MDQNPFNTQPVPQPVTARFSVPSVAPSSLPGAGVVHVSQQPQPHVLQSPGTVATPVVGGGSYPVTVTTTTPSLAALATVKTEPLVIKTEPGVTQFADTTELAGMQYLTLTVEVKQTSHMARCVPFAVARIRVGTGKILHIFPSGTESMGDRDPKRLTLVRPNLVVIDQSWWAVGRGMTDRQTNRME